MYTPSLADSNFNSRINAFNTLSNYESEYNSPTGTVNPMGAIKVEKQGSFTENESGSSLSGQKKARVSDAEINADSKRKIVTSAFEAAVIKVKSSIM